ncbi:hypothetical protein Dimus_012052 [Dionaea muscipula]
MAGGGVPFPKVSVVEEMQFKQPDIDGKFGQSFRGCKSSWLKEAERSTAVE